MRVRYPRTPHLPWSPGASSDDVRLGDLSHFVGCEVVVTEKLDGENTTLYHDGLHARSLDSAHHPSRAWVKALQGRIARRIPPGWRVCGENLYARHSIAYERLESWFHAFSVWDEADRCLGWDETVRFTRSLGIPVPPVLSRGAFDERALRALRLDLGRQEGYVVRTVAGFAREQFSSHVAKWVRTDHVQTEEHWMWSAVVENGRGPASVLWDARSGARPVAETLLEALGMKASELGDADAQARAGDVLGEAAARLDALPRWGDARLAGLLAALLHGLPRAELTRRLLERLDLPLARRVGDLSGLHALLRRPFPDEKRRAGLGRMALAVDLGVLHAVAAAVLGPDAAEAREQVAWSELHAAEAGLFDERHLDPFRAALRAALAGLEPEAADRCWAEALQARAVGRISSPEEAVALTWRWRSGRFPRLVMTVGPSGSGKSRFVAGSLAGHEVVSLDELRSARGARSDQRANDEVLTEGLERLDAHLAAGASVVWDATALTPQQRAMPLGLALRRDALVTQAVFLVPEALLAERNAGRQHSVPAAVLDAQLRRFAPPYPGDAHRIWYIGADGRVGDTAGTLAGEEA